MSTKFNKTQAGFTIIELLIATLVFSIVMVVLLAAFISTSNLFYKGVSMNSTQEDTRSVVQSIADDIKFSQSPPADLAATITTPGPGIFCIGQHRYQYKIGHQLNGSAGDYAVQRDTISYSADCSKTASGNDIEEMLDNGMQLNALNISCKGGRCLVNVHVVFYSGANQDELFSSPGNIKPTNTAKDAECSGGLNGSQICATADFDSTVLENT